MRPEAGQASLAHLAAQLATRCPAELGREIAVTGSVGAGLADEHSDLELLLLVNEVPAVERVRAWLDAVGATDVLAGADASGVWAWCRVDGVDVEPFWGTAREAEAEVDAILASEAIDHARLAFAHVVTHCTVVRGAGLLDRLAERCAEYPETLARRLIEDALAGWEIPSPRLGGALRGDRLAVQGFLLNDSQRVLRIVFALNRRWEPPRWKWLAHHAAGLELAPLRLAQRVQAALVEPDAVAAVHTVHELAHETLGLLPPEIEADGARRGTDLRLAELAGLLVP